MRTSYLLTVFYSMISLGLTAEVYSPRGAPPFDLKAKRQSGYHPEFNNCGTGSTCEEACGDGYQTCLALGSNALFSYNADAGQTCCPGAQGRTSGSGPTIRCVHSISTDSLRKQELVTRVIIVRRTEPVRSGAART